jgi:protein disulfide-isomerase
MRRQRPAFLLIFCAMLAAPVRAQESGGISWMHDLEAAKVQAKQSGRLVLVHFWTPTCGPCLALEQHVFNQAGVASAIEGQFVPVKLNADENSATAQWFGITRVPTDVVVTPDGEIVGKLVSPPTPGAYIAETTGLATKYATRLGQTYAKAAGMAPVQPKINAAYANLQVSPTTPLAAAPPAAVTSNAVPPGSMTPVGSQPASVPFSPNPPMTAALQPALTTNSPPTTTAPPSVSNPYVTAAPSPVAQANPYATMTPPAAPVQQVPRAAAPPQQQAVDRYAQPPQTIVNPALPAAQPQPPVMANSAVSVPDATKLPPNSPPLGFEGYCPVSMRNSWRWVAGDPRWGIVHRGRTYWFASQQEQQQFWVDPDRYAPAMSGLDPVLAIDHQQQVPGKREHSLDYDNLFYMFSSESTLQQFTANPQRYSASVRQAMGITRGRLVR